MNYNNLLDKILRDLQDEAGNQGNILQKNVRKIEQIRDFAEQAELEEEGAGIEEVYFWFPEYR